MHGHGGYGGHGQYHGGFVATTALILFFFSLNIKTSFFFNLHAQIIAILGEKIQKKITAARKNILEFVCGLLMPCLCGFNFTICFSASLPLDSLS